jgi:hypothetical protein
MASAATGSATNDSFKFGVGGMAAGLVLGGIIAGVLYEI